jgi:hypothetical protein
VAPSVELYERPRNPPGSCDVVICTDELAAFTVRVAAILVALATELLTVALNWAPLSVEVLTGVV